MEMLVQHEKNNQRFIIELDNGAEAELKYRLSGESGVDFYSTFVPNTHRGQGLAELLVKTGIDWAKEQNLDMHASCWYARNFL